MFKNDPMLPSNIMNISEIERIFFIQRLMIKEWRRTGYNDYLPLANELMRIFLKLMSATTAVSAFKTFSEYEKTKKNHAKFFKIGAKIFEDPIERQKLIA